MLLWLAKLNCKNPNTDKCPLRGPIFLPYHNHQEISANHPDWPKDEWQGFAICPNCGFGSLYTKQDILWGMCQDLGIPEQNLFRKIELTQ